MHPELISGPSGGFHMAFGRAMKWQMLSTLGCLLTCMKQSTVIQSKPWGHFANKTAKAQGEIK